MGTRFSEFMLVDIAHFILHVAVKFANKLLVDNNIEAVLQILDRLTTEESRMAATMEVVYNPFNNMKLVMNGTEVLLDITFVLNISSLRWKGNQSMISSCIGKMSRADSHIPVSTQKISDHLSEMKCLLFCGIPIKGS